MRVSRRDILFAAGAGAAAAVAASVRSARGQPAPASRPNIVWVMGDDVSPTLGCYGDTTVPTPNLDRLAAQGATYTQCYNVAPVCSPARSGLITGMYPTSICAHLHRGVSTTPRDVIPALLRDAGYAVVWGRAGKGGKSEAKVDFNFPVKRAWADAPVDWVAAAPRSPFFATVNAFDAHEGEIRDLSRDEKLRARVKLPPYLPDAPEVRGQIARYYEKIRVIDDRVGEILAGLEKQRLLDSTVVMFFGDNGWALPRGKRWLYDTGIRSPLLVRYPKSIKPGTTCDDLVSLIDVGATTLALAGVALPRDMQAQPFLGDTMPKPRELIFAARDRIDAVADRVRCVRDKRWKYIRNYRPHIPWMGPDAYLDEAPAVQAMRALHKAGSLTGPAAAWFADHKPAEELYDTVADPWEVRNLAAAPAHAATLARLRTALDAWIKETVDLGEFPESDLIGKGLLKPA